MLGKGKKQLTVPSFTATSSRHHELYTLLQPFSAAPGLLTLALGYFNFLQVTLKTISQKRNGTGSGSVSQGHQDNRMEKCACSFGKECRREWPKSAIVLPRIL